MECKERRGFPRIPVHYESIVEINNVKLDCSIENLSESGSLILIKSDNEKIINEQIVGSEINFTFTDKEKAFIKFNGRIVRFFIKDNQKYIGVEFCDNFYFEY